MKKVIYGTYNPAKVSSMRKNLEGLKIEVLDLSSFPSLVSADEVGKDPLENAIIKAKGYYEQLKQPVFSCDTGLYFENVKEEHQPGVKARRINGFEMDDETMREFYGNLADTYGGKLTAYYKNAICLIVSEDEIYTYDGEDLNSEKFYIIKKAHKNLKKGFPLDALSIDIESGKYYEDLQVNNKNLAVHAGFRTFFKKTLLGELTDV